jgi:NAD(P)-dependent dehydrogenase (short-subunit alcohol dehydrogenase family)
MNDSPLRLQDKSVLLYGDFTSLTQALIHDFTEQGADVALLNCDSPQPGRFIENVNDAREAHPNFGKAFQIAVDVKNKTSAFDAISKMAETFGRVDAMVDLKMSSLGNADFDNEPSRLLQEELTPFFKHKKKGRVVFIREDESIASLLQEGLLKQLKEEFLPWARSLAETWPGPGFGVNVISVGLTEDLLLKRFPLSKSIKSSLENLQKDHPKMQLMDSTEITSVAMFLSSLAASGVNGQILKVTR